MWAELAVASMRFRPKSVTSSLGVRVVWCGVVCSRVGLILRYSTFMYKDIYLIVYIAVCKCVCMCICQCVYVRV